MEKVPPSRPFVSPPFWTGSNPTPLSRVLAWLYPLKSFPQQTPLLICNLPNDLTKITQSRWVKELKNGETQIERERQREWKTHHSQKNLDAVQRQKSFPHFTADNRQREERGRPVPTAQSFKTNETLCVSRVDRGPAQTRHVHRSLHSLSASGTSAVWNRTGSSLSFSFPVAQALETKSLWLFLDFSFPLRGEN